MANATSAGPPRLAEPPVLRRPSAPTGVLLLLLLYLAAARELGTTAFPIAELSHLPGWLRRRTDTVLERPVDRAPQTPWHLLIVPGHGVATCLR